MVHGECGAAAESAKAHSTNMNSDLQAKQTIVKPYPLVESSSLSTQEARRQFLSLDGVCHTAGYVSSQNPPQTGKYPSNVRFTVQPVLEDKHISDDTSVPSYPSTDDVRSSYGYMGSDPQAQLTVRSMASIGLGSSDGRKIHLRRVHTTGADLVSPLLFTPDGEPMQSQFQFPSITMNGKTVSGLGGEMVPPTEESSSSEDDDSDTGRDKKKHRHRHRPGYKSQTWGSRLEFLLACVGFAAGLGNIWRFPYTAFKSGGGAFLIPYCVMVFLCGIPMQILELAVGQYTREGPVEAMSTICPLLSGVGVGMVLLSMLLSSYYSVVMSWAMLYLGSSFTSQLPWTHCNNTWNTDHCRPGSLLGIDDNMTEVYNGTMLGHNWTTPGQEFFDRRILQMTDDVTVMGDVQWELVVCLLIAWALLYVTIRKSVRWSGKFVYVTATLPYVLLLALTARALTLEGADDGLRYFFHPNWALLLKAEVWVNALAQAFMSMGVAYGCLIAFASYNRFHSPFVRDGLCLSILNLITSLVAGIIVFAALGHTAFLQGVPIEQAATDGLSLSLVMYSTVVSRMPFPQVWSAFLFIMFIFIGLDTQFATVEVVILTLHRFVKQCFNKAGGMVADLVVIGMCLACFIGAIPYITQGGIYLMHLTDYYVCTVAIILLALTVAMSVGVVYGAARVHRNVREMTSHSPSPILVACWAGVTPLLILGVYIFHLIGMEKLTYDHGQYLFPEWTAILGWSVLGLILAAIPAFAFLAIYQATGKSLFQKIINSTKSQLTECPCCGRGVLGLKDTHSQGHLNDVNVGQNTAFAFAEYAEITYPDEGSYTVTSASSLPFPPTSPMTPAITVHYPSDPLLAETNGATMQQSD